MFSKRWLSDKNQKETPDQNFRLGSLFFRQLSATFVASAPASPDSGRRTAICRWIGRERTEVDVQVSLVSPRWASKPTLSTRLRAVFFLASNLALSPSKVLNGAARATHLLLEQLLLFLLTYRRKPAGLPACLLTHSQAHTNVFVFDCVIIVFVFVE